MMLDSQLDAECETVVFLSACLVVYHEEALIERCLRSIKPLCDEIIVVHDGKCEDRTLEIAREYGAVVAELERSGEAETHRPATFAMARGEWVFQIDADEFLTPEAVALLKCKLNNPGQIDGLSLIWPVWNGLRYLSSKWPHKPCVFRKAAMHFVGFVHSEVTVDGVIEPLSARLEHQPVYNNYSLSTYLHKHRKWVFRQVEDLLLEIDTLPSFRPRKPEKWPTHMEVIRRYGRMAIPINVVILFLGAMLSGGWRNPYAALLVYRQGLFYYSELAVQYVKARQRRNL